MAKPIQLWSKISRERMRAPPGESCEVSGRNRGGEITTVSEIIKTTSAKGYKKII